MRPGIALKVARARARAEKAARARVAQTCLCGWLSLLDSLGVIWVCIPYAPVCLRFGTSWWQVFALTSGTMVAASLEMSVASATKHRRLFQSWLWLWNYEIRFFRLPMDFMELFKWTCSYFIESQIAKTGPCVKLFRRRLTVTCSAVGRQVVALIQLILCLWTPNLMKFEWHNAHVATWRRDVLRQNWVFLASVFQAVLISSVHDTEVLKGLQLTMFEKTKLACNFHMHRLPLHTEAFRPLKPWYDWLDFKLMLLYTRLVHFVYDSWSTWWRYFCWADLKFKVGVFSRTTGPVGVFYTGSS